MGGILVAILVNWVRYLSGSLKQVRFGCNIGELGREIMWPTKRGDFGCDIGKLDGVFKCEVGEILCATRVNQVGYLSGLLKWVGFCLQYW